MIKSKSNIKIKYVKSLYASKNRKKFKQFVVEGRNCVDMAKNANCIDYIISINNNDEGILVSKEVMKSIVSTSSLIDVIAVCNIPFFSSKSDKVLVLENIQDPGNLGALIRSALAFNFDLIVCSKSTVDFMNSKVIRASGGSIFQIKIIYDDIASYLKKSKNKTIGTFVDGKNDIIKLDKFNLVIGNEGTGISADIELLCDYKHSIKINENLDSLNAAVAGSILMYQLGG
ncbi:MAG: TrmH family RNA methyltransferase [Bacilli bacterium]